MSTHRTSDGLLTDFAGSERREWWVAGAGALLIGAMLLGLACRGHFIKPHGDFYGFRETGWALLHGETPPTFKQAPAYPLLLASVGALVRAVGRTSTPADQVAAEWINALLLPCNVLLCYAIGRRWLGRLAPWAALWVLLPPIGLYCTTHTLVEPLLLATILSTVRLAQSGSRWAYLAAAVATVTRYDAAGLIVGVAAADIVRRRNAAGVVWRTLLACIPLAAWMLPTWLTWETNAQDHYLRQLANAGDLDFVWPLTVSLRCVFDLDRFATPIWFAEWGPRLADAVRVATAAAAVVGGAALLRRRDSGGVAAAAFLAGYWLVHAVFPFRDGFERFGYPPAPLLILAAGVGIEVVARRLRAATPSRSVRALLTAFAGAVLAMLVWGEAARLHDVWPTLQRFHKVLPLLAAIAVVLVFLGAWRNRGSVRGIFLLTLTFGLLALVQIRTGRPLLGDGTERINDVLAARWVRDVASPAEGVLTDTPGLLRLYCGDRPRERFLGYGEIKANDWVDILAECRRRGVAYVIWHDQVFSEQGAYYIAKWRLNRYSALDDPRRTPGVEIVRQFADRPNLWILRILPE